MDEMEGEGWTDSEAYVCEWIFKCVSLGLSVSIRSNIRCPFNYDATVYSRTN